MDLILDAIDEALKKKGLSDAAASKAAVGNYALIKNMRSSRSSNKRYNVAGLQKLAEVLDLEFYFGPKRLPENSALDGFAEQAAKFIHSVDGSAEALREGFLPIPYSSFDEKHAKDGFSPIAFSRNWIISNGLHPDNLSAIEAMNNRMAPTIRAGSLVMVDTAPSSKDNQVWAFLENGKLDIARLNFLDGNGMVLIRDHPDENPQLIDHNKLTSIAPIGRIIWTGFNLGDE